MDFAEFVSVNSAFVLTLVSLCGGFFTGISVYMLKSRCVKIKCCCIFCEREPLSENVIQEMNNTNRLNGDSSV